MKSLLLNSVCFAAVVDAGSTPVPADEVPPATAPLSDVQKDAVSAVDDGANVAKDFIERADSATISADAAAFLKDVEQLGYDEVKSLLADLLEFKGAGLVNDFKSFFTHIGTQIGGLISRL